MSSEYGTWLEMGYMEAIKNYKRNFTRNNHCFCEKVPSDNFLYETTYYEKRVATTKLLDRIHFQLTLTCSSLCLVLLEISHPYCCILHH